MQLRGAHARRAGKEPRQGISAWAPGIEGVRGVPTCKGCCMLACCALSCFPVAAYFGHLHLAIASGLRAQLRWAHVRS